MANYIAARIRKRPYFKLSPLRSGRSERRPYVIGFDSESEQVVKRERGKPFLFQFAHPNGECDFITVGLEKDAGLGEFFTYLFNHCKDRTLEYLVYGFNLQYEWTQIFHDVPNDVKNADEFDITLITGPKSDPIEVHIRGMNNKRYMLTCEFGGTKRRVKVIDAMAYFPMSLDSASEIIGIGKKLAKPHAFTRSIINDVEFTTYAAQDAILTQKLGEYITNLHKQFDIIQSISSPHFAARTFRHCYLTREIPLPSETLEQYGLDSYHGGKNGFYLLKPMFVKNVWSYDIRSAYPEAMRQLPNVETAEWIATDHYIPNAHGIYEVTGTYIGCKPRAFMTHDSKWVPKGYFANLRITSYELDTALALGEVQISKCEGYLFIGDSGGPLMKYVDDFYAMKRNAKTLAERATAKLFLNSLYGKFFQKVPLGDVTSYDLRSGEMIRTNLDEPWDYEAGGLYHPPIASLITGFVRAKIHRLEHKYNAIMTSTDGFFAYNPPDDSELGDDLGQLEASIGSLRIWRERLYVFRSYKDQSKPKFALHGFRGKLAQLERMPLRAGNIFHYEAEAMITLKMSLRTFDGKHYEPGEFVQLPFDLILVGKPAP